MIHFPTIRDVQARAVDVPLKRPLGTSAATLRTAPLVLVDVISDEGIVGHAYLFAYTRAAGPAIIAMLHGVLDAVRGDPVAPIDLGRKLGKHFRLIGVQGVVRMALAAFDICCWDILAKAANQPLARLLGTNITRVPAYNSNGLGLMAPAQVAAEAVELLEGGFSAIKLRLGFPTLTEDLANLRAVRRAVPDSVSVMVDFNQGLDLPEALKRGYALDQEGAAWIEEPIRHDDYPGNAQLARELTTPIQIGENFSGPHAMAVAISQRASDIMMPDLERIGGVTGWQRAASLAYAHDIPISTHLFPEVSAHLLAATPTAHLLEYVDWANPILAEPLVIENGHAVLSTRPGAGLSWDEAAIKRYLYS